MKKTITRQVFLDAKALLVQGKKHLKIAKKLKISVGTVSKIKNSKYYSNYLGKKTLRINKVDLDRNIALDRKVKKLQVEVKKDPAFAKFVEGQVALVVDEKVIAATEAKQKIIDSQTTTIGESKAERDALVLEMADLTKEVTYKEKVYAQVESIAKSLSKIAVPAFFLIGFIWISWLLVNRFGL